ncbi:MAG: hypothetical protein ACXQTR_04990 [Candidatus Methanospirareceae archaeon]
MPQIDMELEHRDVFEAKIAAEIALNRIYAGNESYDDLRTMTAAMLNYWRKIRPYVMTKFTTYYDDGLKLLDKIETTVKIRKERKVYGIGYNERKERGVLTYEQGVEALKKLNEIYVKIGYGKVIPEVETFDISPEAEVSFDEGESA